MLNNQQMLLFDGFLMHLDDEVVLILIGYFPSRYYLGVKEEFGRRGIARRLTEETIRLSRQRNADFVQSFPTSPGTLHLFEQLGFETLSEMKLVDHFLDGQPGFPFAQSADDFARYVAKIL